MISCGIPDASVTLFPRGYLGGPPVLFVSSALLGYIMEVRWLSLRLAPPVTLLRAKEQPHVIESHFTADQIGIKISFASTHVCIGKRLRTTA